MMPFQVASRSMTLAVTFMLKDFVDACVSQTHFVVLNAKLCMMPGKKMIMMDVGLVN